ncbi:MAG: ABC transporter substrate-binding protein [Deltaproteobacteria bacterium]|nr:ABC transporter substrate-binding protein [Deltaproteobacteria bacterium]
MRMIIALASFLVFGFQPLMADDVQDITKMTRDKIQVVIQILRDKKIGKETRDKRIIEAANPFFDFKKMASISLGKKYWTEMNKAQKQEFSDLFVTRLQESYLEKLDLYTDEEVTVADAKKVKNRIHILTQLVSKDDKKDMLYKFYKTKKGWKVYDVVILGVSVVQTYRSQFDGILRKGSIEDLLTKMRLKGQFKVPTGGK